MSESKGIWIAKGIGLALAYLLAYRLLHYISFNQWFLPAGLRLMCLLLLPYRFWPFVFLGDAGALLSIRAKMADDYGALWAYLSPFIHSPLISLAPLAIKKQARNQALLFRLFPAAAALTAFWASACMMSVNYGLDGPTTLVSWKNFFRYGVGDFLGIMMLGLPTLLLIARRRHQFFERIFNRHVALCTAAVLGIFLLIEISADVEEAERQLLLMLMITPIAFLTFQHGWKGAAVGTIIVNLAMAQCLTYTGVPGTHDQSVFVAQIGLALSTGILLTLGSRISMHYDRARGFGLAHQQAMKVAHTSFLSTEPMLRDQLIYMAHMQMMLDDERARLALWLRSNGKHQEAMALNTQGMEHRRAFDEQALALYPIDIERNGLYAVIYSQAFRDFWAGEADVALRIDDGNVKGLPVDLQLVAYRCLCHAMVALSDCEPEQFRIRLRVWRTAMQHGIYIRVTVIPTADPHPTPAAATASTLLQSRLSAHGGLLHRHAHRISMLIGEPHDTDQRLRTTQRVTLPS